VGQSAVEVPTLTSKSATLGWATRPTHRPPQLKLPYSLRCSKAGNDANNKITTYSYDAPE